MWCVDFVLIGIDMAKRKLNIGDVFSVVIDNEFKSYFQYVFYDDTYKDPVIRVFRKRFPVDHPFDIEEIKDSGVMYYSHADLHDGLDLKIWKKEGKSPADDVSSDDVVFGIAEANKDCSEEDSVFVRGPLYHWNIWTAGKQMRDIGKLPAELVDSVEFGHSAFYRGVIERIRLGYYTGYFPEYDVLKRRPHSFVHSYLRRHERLDARRHYWHFLGENLLEEIVVENGACKRFSESDGFGVEPFRDKIKFWEINWEERDFITREEFEEVWNVVEKHDAIPESGVQRHMICEYMERLLKWLFKLKS